MVDAQAGFSLDGHTREPLRVGFTERAGGSLELPARAAAAAREQTPAPGLDAGQLGHRRQGSARRAIPATPPLLVSPTVEGVHHGTEEPRHRRPRQIPQQPGERRCERLVAQHEVRDAARALRLAPQCRVESAGLRHEHPRRRSGGQSLEKRCRHSPTRFEIDGGIGARQQRHAGAKVRGVILPVGNAGVEDVDPGRRAIDPLGEVGQRPEVRMRFQPRIRSHRLNVPRWAAPGRAPASDGPPGRRGRSSRQSGRSTRPTRRSTAHSFRVRPKASGP